MKKVFILLFCVVSLCSYAQTKKKYKQAKKVVEDSTLVEQPVDLAVTSIEEYNYMTKGYKVQTESGLDNKKGYDLDALPLVDESLYSFQFIALKRSSTGQLCGVICKATSKAWGNVYYLGIPINNPQLFTSYYAEIEKWDKPMSQAYAKYSSVLFGSVLASLYQK